ncbi:MAG: hypothetical protein IJS32_09670 [Kiritimatiellae bacterium]|nr:hypothetical protein [Kiritimatiellia bacterium]
MPVASGEEELRAREALAEARLFLVQTAAFLLLAFLAWGTGFSRDAADRWLAAWQPAPGGWLEWAAVRFSFVAAWILAYEILLFPVSVVLGGGAEDAAAGRFAAWCKRHLLGVAGESAFLGTVFLAFYALQRFSPGWWWLAAAGLYAFLQIGCGLFADAWILPALHPPRPLEDPALLASVRRAGSRAGLDVRGLCVRETGDRVTVSGLGNRVRVVFPEAMAADGAADAETKAFFAAKAVAARSLAADGTLCAVNVLSAACALFLASRFTQTVAHAAGLPGGDGALAAFPLLAGSLFALGEILGGAYHALSRALELRSDRLAADWAGGKEVARKAIAADAEAAGEPRELPAWATWLRKTPTPGERMRAVDGTRAGE